MGQKSLRKNLRESESKDANLTSKMMSFVFYLSYHGKGQKELDIPVMWDEVNSLSVETSNVKFIRSWTWYIRKQ